MTLRGLPRASSALVSAATLNLPSCSVDIAHPTTRREKRSITGARYSQPALVRTYFTSVTHSRLRAECLNAQVFESLEDAGETLTSWRSDYNAVRPHSALGMLTPREFAELGQRNAGR
jgi:transposase InsO family protein